MDEWMGRGRNGHGLGDLGSLSRAAGGHLRQLARGRPLYAEAMYSRMVSRICETNLEVVSLTSSGILNSLLALSEEKGSVSARSASVHTKVLSAAVGTITTIDKKSELTIHDSYSIVEISSTSRGNLPEVLHRDTKHILFMTTLISTLTC